MPTVSGSGSKLVISGGVTSSGIIILQQGEVDVLAGGTTVATTATFAQEFVSAGGVASNTVLSSGGLLGLLSGGSATNTTV